MTSATNDAPSRAALGVLFLTVFLDLLGFGLVIPMLPLYARDLHIGTFFIGPIFAAYSLMQFLFAPIWGMLSDRIGRRPVILVSVFGSVVAYAMTALATGPVMLFSARAFGGLCGANLAATQAYIADVTSERDRARGMGIIGAAFGIGFVLGPAIAGILSKHLGMTAPFWAASGLALVNVVSAALLLPEPTRHARPAEPRRNRFVALADAVRLPGLGALIILFFLSSFAFAKLEATFALWLAQPPFRYDAGRVGYVFAFIGIVLIIVQGGLVGRLARRFGEARLVQIATGFMATGMLLLPRTHTLTGLLLIVAVIAVGNGLNNPSATALVSSAAPPERQGEVLGVAQSISSLGRIFGPPVGAFLFAHFSSAAPYWVGGSVMGGACVVALARVRGVSSERKARE